MKLNTSGRLGVQWRLVDCASPARAGRPCHWGALLLVMGMMGVWDASVMGQSRERGSPRGFEGYQVVVDQNMFLRERGRRTEPEARREREPEERAPEAPPARREQLHVLRGLVFEGEEPLAFFENMQEGQTRAYRQGDVLLNGRIESISLRGVEYEAGEQRVRVGLGEDLLGERSTGVTGIVTAPSGGESEASPRPMGNLSEVELRMRQRRMQEGGGR